ncbi:ABC-type transporter, integral membrane subunit [Deinococcus proteolyticus MRP]|uniref:ABC-type transporter, integral membrane subunit n=1 Tax=Deinococcus proteolyticus (strain ATCC 35074 / DSM 20540 / JCM 6276 / NBRC 101906 / NCIMB 13154 / VKM Ac-1939 / CCM 2703 / MRP) TaxID=693977 RepID=F0RPD2_DEIPM|nr:iron ABC transporter permease [Deinococcus proteolyticus]ADY26475.1 ABC-type transporter, integral membrane subunit [Deinococcus proteolyticus MRP]
MSDRTSQTRPPLLLTLPALLAALGVGLPMVYLLREAFGADLTAVREILWRGRNLELLGNTLLLTVSVVAAGTLIALPLAYLVGRTTFRPRRLLALLGVLPLAVPGYVGAYALIAASGAGGALDALVGWAPPAPGGFGGALLALTLFTFPYLFLNLYAGLRAADPALEEAARLLGRTPWQTFTAVTLPALRPAWLAGALLVALHVLGDFAVVSLMRYPTFSAAIYQQYTAAYDTVYAAWLVLALLVLTGAALWLEARLLRGVFLSRVSGGAVRPHRRHALGAWAVPAWVLVLALAALTLALPLGTALYWLRLEVSPYVLADVWDAARLAGGSAAVTAALTAALAFVLAYIGSRYSGWLPRLAERVAYLGYATPPLALALSLVFFTLAAVPALYQTLPLLVLAYTLHFAAEAIGPLRSALLRATPRLEEAARVLGHAPAQAMRRVTLPIVLPGVLVSAAFVFLSVLKELPLTLLLAPAGFTTLAVGVWTYTEEALYGSAAPYALALMLAGAVLSLLILRREKL